ncbi:MAG TPA: lipoprotein [Rhodanobacteraceae bacterium]|nr:lipoprotein [Rhodanobacteraceae bacterium]
MPRIRFATLVPLTLAMLLAACGNKGDLVRPTPASTPPATDQPAPPSPAPSGTDATHDTGGQ